jgi:hypothetical protein
MTGEMAGRLDGTGSQAMGNSMSAGKEGRRDGKGRERGNLPSSDDLGTLVHELEAGH